MSREALLARFSLDDLIHVGRIWRGFQGLTEFLFMEELRDLGERVKMFLELALRNQEEHDKIDGLIIKGIEIDALFGTPEGADDFVNEVCGGVRNAYAKADAGAHGGFPLFDHGGDSLAMLGFDL